LKKDEKGKEKETSSSSKDNDIAQSAINQENISTEHDFDNHNNPIDKNNTQITSDVPTREEKKKDLRTKRTTKKRHTIDKKKREEEEFKPPQPTETTSERLNE